MAPRWVLAVVLAASAGGNAGCAIKASGSVAQPTALELQLLGAYRKLDDELVRSASIRSAGPLSLERRRSLKAAAVDARAMQRFNQDDTSELKAAGCVAEGLTAQLLARPCGLVERDPTAARRRRRVVAQENAARRALLAWAAATLSADGDRVRNETLAEVRTAYVRLLRAGAEPGHLFETAPGEFESVKR